MGRRVSPTSFQPFPRNLIRNHPNVQVIFLSNKEKNSFHLCNTTRSRILNKRLQPNAQSCTSKLSVHKSLIRNLTSPHTQKITNATTSTSFFFFFFNHTVFRLSSTTQATQNPEVFFSPSKPETKTSEIIFPSQPKTDSKATKPKRTSTSQCTNLSAAAAAIVPEDHSSARRHHQIPSSSQNHLPSRSCVFLHSPGGQPRPTIYQKTFFLSASSFFHFDTGKKISPLIRPQSVQRVKCQTESP